MRKIEILKKELEEAKKKKYWSQVEYLADQILYIVQMGNFKERNNL